MNKNEKPTPPPLFRGIPNVGISFHVNIMFYNCRTDFSVSILCPVWAVYRNTSLQYSFFFWPYVH